MKQYYIRGVGHTNSQLEFITIELLLEYIDDILGFEQINEKFELFSKAGIKKMMINIENNKIIRINI